MKKSINPSLVLNMDEMKAPNLPNDEIERIRSDWEKTFTGPGQMKTHQEKEEWWKGLFVGAGLCWLVALLFGLFLILLGKL